MSETPGYTLLGHVETPQDLRKLPAHVLPQLAVELRRHLIETLGRVGGHSSPVVGSQSLRDHRKASSSPMMMASSWRTAGCCPPWFIW